MIRISSVSLGFDTIWIRLGLRNLSVPLFPVIWLKEKEKKKRKKRRGDREIGQEVNLNGDQRCSIPAGLFDGSSSDCESEGRVKKRRASSLPLTIPYCRHPFLFQSPLPSIPSFKSPSYCSVLFPASPSLHPAQAKALCSYPTSQRDKLKCVAHTLSLSLSNLLRD